MARVRNESVDRDHCRVWSKTMRKDKALWGVLIGAGIGASLGVALDNLAIGVAIGAGVGLALGSGGTPPKHEDDSDS